MMRRAVWLSLCVALILTGVTGAGVVPRLVNYQGRLTYPSGDPAPDGAHSITFRFFNAAAGGTLLWQETQNVTTVKGIFSVLLGSVDSLPPYVFSGDSCYLEMEPQGSSPLTPRSHITTVPYAFRAQNADLLGGLPNTDFASPIDIDVKMAEHLAAVDPHHSKTIDAGDLIIGTLAKERLPKHEIDSSNIADASLSSKQILDAPGISHTFNSLVPIASTMRIVDSAFVVVPAWGYVLILASGWFYDYHTAGLEAHATISISSSRTSHDNSYTAKFDVATTSPVGHTSEDFVIQRVVTVGPGQLKLFLLANMIGTEFPNVQNVHLNTIFLPKSYGEVDALAH